MTRRQKTSYLQKDKRGRCMRLAERRRERSACRMVVAKMIEREESQMKRKFLKILYRSLIIIGCLILLTAAIYIIYRLNKYYTVNEIKDWKIGEIFQTLSMLLGIFAFIISAPFLTTGIALRWMYKNKYSTKSSSGKSRTKRDDLCVLSDFSREHNHDNRNLPQHEKVLDTNDCLKREK